MGLDSAGLSFASPHAQSAAIATPASIRFIEFMVLLRSLQRTARRPRSDLPRAISLTSANCRHLLLELPARLRGRRVELLGLALQAPARLPPRERVDDREVERL